MSKQNYQSKTKEQKQIDALVPFLKKMPPKQLISSQYLPDEEANIVLVTNRDLRKNNINFIPPKSKDNQLETYASHFNKVDYLGHWLAPRINDIVFFKFNNTKYNLFQNNINKNRIMTAFYVPFHQIYSEDEDFFTKKIGLKFPETNNKALLPSSKYHRGCAFDPIFSSQFLNGNLFAASRKEPYEYELFLQNDVNSCLETSWFNFSVEFYEVGYYTFRIKNITRDMSKLFNKGLKLNFLLHSAISQEAKKDIGEDWGYGGENISFSKTNIENQSRPGEYYYELYFQYMCKNKHDIGVFSMDIPYNPVDCQKFFNNMIYKKVKGMTRIEKIQYGRTISGTPLSAYLIKKKKTGSDTEQLSAQITQALFGLKPKRKSFNLTPINKLLLQDQSNIKSVMIIGRMGASDVSSSHIIEGMVQYLLDTLDFDSLKRQINFYFIPMSNADGVKYGTTVTNLTGTHLHNDWRNTHKIYQAETHSLKEFMNETNKKYPISAVISLTSENKELYSSIWGARNDPQEAEDSRIFPYLLSKKNKMFSFQNSFFFDKNGDHMCAYLTETYPKALIYQFNISRFELAKPSEENLQSINVQEQELKQCSLQSYRNLGKELLSNYLEHIKLFDKNSLLREKWIRQVESIQGNNKIQPFLFLEKPIQERFTEKYYQIKPHYDPPSMTDIRGTQKSQKSEPKSSAFLEISKIFQIPFLNEINKSPKKNLPKRIPFRTRKANQSGSIDQNDKSLVQDKDKSPSQKKNLFRIEERKQLPLKSHCPNTLNFDFMASQTPSRLENNSMNQKTGMKKEISAKMLRKVDAFKERYGRSKFVSP